MARVSYDEAIATRIFVALMVLAVVNVVLGVLSVAGGPRRYTGKVVTVALLLGVTAAGFALELPRERKGTGVLIGSGLIIALYLFRGLWDPPA